MEETHRLRELSLRCTRLAQDIIDPDMIIALKATAAKSDAAADVLDATPKHWLTKQRIVNHLLESKLGPPPRFASKPV
jgi:hypothetical protein